MHYCPEEASEITLLVSRSYAVGSVDVSLSGSTVLTEICDIPHVERRLWSSLVALWAFATMSIRIHMKI